MPDSEGAVVSKGGYAPRLEDLLLPRVPTPPLVSMPIGEVPARPSRRGNVQWGEDEVQGARVTPSAVAPGASHLVLGDQVMSPTLKPKHAKSNVSDAPLPRHLQLSFVSRTGLVWRFLVVCL